MYGSGSLRPPGTNPAYIHNQRSRGRKPSPSPPLPPSEIQPPRRYPIPISHYPIIPVPVAIPSHDFDRIPDGYPLFIHDTLPNVDLISSSRSGGYSRNGNRVNGMYGGRPEYSRGRPRGKYPMDLGFIMGKGYDRIGPEHSNLRYGRPPNLGIVGHATTYMKEPDSEIGGEEGMDQRCVLTCSEEEFLCSRDCECIKNTSR